MEVPDAETVKNWIGVDRGQNQIAVASLPNGFGKFWNGSQSDILPRTPLRFVRGFPSSR